MHMSSPMIIQCLINEECARLEVIQSGRRQTLIRVQYDYIDLFAPKEFIVQSKLSRSSVKSSCNFWNSRCPINHVENHFVSCTCVRLVRLPRQVITLRKIKIYFNSLEFL